MTKKILSILLLVLSLTLILTGCGGGSDTSAEDEMLNSEEMTVAAPEVIGTWTADIDGSTYTWIFNPDSTYSMSIKGTKDKDEVDSSTMGTFVAEANKLILTPQETTAEAQGADGTDQIQATDPGTPVEYYFAVGRNQESDKQELSLTSVTDGAGYVYEKQ